jgi:hypothetical protein
MKFLMRRNHFFAAVSLGVLLATTADAHDHSQKKAEEQRRAAAKKAAAAAEPDVGERQPRCQLTIEFRDREGKPLPAALVRVTNLESAKALSIPEGIHRAMNWYSLPSRLAATLPRTRIRIDAIYGIETELGSIEVDLSGQKARSVVFSLKRLDTPSSRSLRSGNTHLHLMKMTYLEALRYLEVVPQSDGLDLVFLSHLRRVPDDRDYISNRIVENSFMGGDLQRLSQHGVAFSVGEEHRHNFGRGGEGYGHVMFLDLMRLVEPVSLGPGIMAEGTDGLPLQHGIHAARDQGATVIWCHNTFGYEDIPNWAAGLLHAQNIHDGGEHGSYKDTYYKYLNLGMHVPFSTGTDWFIYDFSRVYVPVPEPLTSQRWLTALRQGKSTITNGPLLELTINGRSPGDTIPDNGPLDLAIRGRAIGRHDFHAIELIHNGAVVQTVPSKSQEQHFVAELQVTLRAEAPGWFALRIPETTVRNELDKELFAHTSPIYFEPGRRRIFQAETARDLIREINANVELIQKQGKFANDAERNRVLSVHHAGIEALQKQIKNGKP